MGQFISTLKTEQVTESTLLRKAEYVLTAPLVYNSNTLCGFIIVPEGFRTDYASVPRLPIIYTLLGNLGNSAACLHDYLYTEPHMPIPLASCNPVTRELADKILRGAIIDGMVCGSKETTIWQSIKNIVYVLVGWCFYIGVRIGGRSHWGKIKK